MNKFYMSLDEVGKNEFYIACLYLVKDIIRDVEKREGFNMDRNNYHLLTDDEIFILGLYNRHCPKFCVNGNRIQL